MPEAKRFTYGGCSIVLIDVSYVKDYGGLPGVVDDAIRLVHCSNAPHSVLGLIDLSCSRIRKPLLVSLKRLSKNNGPFMKAVVFVGLSAPWRMLVSAFLRISGRKNHRVMPDRQSGFQWLIQQQSGVSAELSPL
jgi:hypothetical protein